jgi:hypothetical protein
MNPLSSQCTARSKRTGERCRRLVVGGGVCPMHGGRAPQVAARREARILAGEAALAVQDLDPRDPAVALLSAAQDADRIVRRLKSTFAAGVVVDGAVLATLGEWLDRVSRLSKVVVDARIDERRARLDERMGGLLVGVITAVLAALDLADEQRARVPELVARELRVIEQREVNT